MLNCEIKCSCLCLIDECFVLRSDTMTCEMNVRLYTGCTLTYRNKSLDQYTQVLARKTADHSLAPKPESYPT